MARRPRSVSWPDRLSLASLVWKLATPVGGSSGRSTLGLPRGGSQAELPRQPQSVGDNVLPHNAPLTEVIDGNARHGRGLAGQRIVSARSPTVDHRIPFCDLLLDHVLMSGVRVRMSRVKFLMPSYVVMVCPAVGSL